MTRLGVRPNRVAEIAQAGEPLAPVGCSQLDTWVLLRQTKFTPCRAICVAYFGGIRPKRTLVACYGSVLRRLVEALVKFRVQAANSRAKRTENGLIGDDEQMSKESVVIRPVTNVADARKLEEIQSLTWGMSEIEVLPGRFLHAMHFNGACLLGAYDGADLIGFVSGLLGTVQGLDDRIDQVAAARLQMYSAIMGVMPDYQGTGVGYRLKVAQREFALRIGVRLITWTYDPLEGRNGYLNIRKLGVVCNQYERDFHGEVGGINAGLPTDRFYVEWWVTSHRAKGRLAARRPPLTLDNYMSGGAVIVNRADRDDSDFVTPPAAFERVHSRFALVEIPNSIQKIKEQDMELAGNWRTHTRDLFEYYFAQNYLLTDFVRFEDSGGFWRSYYVLTLGNS